MTTFRLFRVLCDTAPTVDGLGYQASPPLVEGQVVYGHDGATRGCIPAGHVAVTLEPGAPWFTVPADAVKES